MKSQKITYNRRVPPAVSRFFQEVFIYDLDKRFGARSTPDPNGSLVNAELRSHSLLEDITWNRIAMRIDPVHIPYPRMLIPSWIADSGIIPRHLSYPTRSPTLTKRYI